MEKRSAEQPWTCLSPLSWWWLRRIGTKERIFVGTHPLVERPPQRLGWRTGKNHTLVGGNFAYHRMMSAVDGAPPHPSPSWILSIPGLYCQYMLSPLPGFQLMHLSIGLRLPSLTLSPGSIPLHVDISFVRWPRYSWNFFKETLKDWLIF